MDLNESFNQKKKRPNVNIGFYSLSNNDIYSSMYIYRVYRISSNKIRVKLLSEKKIKV